MKKLAIITTHPIQYYAPLFELLNKSADLDLRVFYTGGNKNFNRFDKGFKKEIIWDLPLLDGYNYTFLENESADPGTHHFNGIINTELTAEIDKFNPTAILIYGWAWKSHYQIIRQYADKKTIWFRGDSTLLDSSNVFKSFVKKIYLKWLFRKIDRAFYAGIENKKYFLEYGLKEKSLTFMPHAIDNKRFSVIKNEEVLKLKEKLKINPNDVVILFAGKFEQKKSPILLLRAFLKISNPSIKLLFVGNGVLEDQIKALGKKDSRVSFMPFANQLEMPLIYQLCDLFCLPSAGPGETWGLAVNEAMAGSKAILVSNKVGCSSDLVKDGHNGYIFKSGDINDLHNKLLLLTASKEKLVSMGKASHEIIKAYSFQKQADCIMLEINKL